MKFKVSVDIECGDSWDFEVDREKLKPELRELPAWKEDVKDET